MILTALKWIPPFLEYSDGMKEISKRPVKKAPTFRGKTFCFLGEQQDLSLLAASARMSADTLPLNPHVDSFTSSDSILNYLDDISAAAIDLLSPSYRPSGFSRLLGQHLNCSVINFGDGYLNDPMMIQWGHLHKLKKSSR